MFSAWRAKPTRAALVQDRVGFAALCPPCGSSPAEAGDGGLAFRPLLLRERVLEGRLGEVGPIVVAETEHEPPHAGHVVFHDRSADTHAGKETLAEDPVLIVDDHGTIHAGVCLPCARQSGGGNSTQTVV